MSGSNDSALPLRQRLHEAKQSGFPFLVCFPENRPKTKSPSKCVRQQVCPEFNFAMPVSFQFLRRTFPARTY